jgi:hypothetical protein
MFRVRFRFWLQKKLSLDKTEHHLVIAGRSVVLCAPMTEVSIADSEWLVMNAHGIESEAEAFEFSRKLKASTELFSAMARLGVDAGIDKPTTQPDQTVADALKSRDGIEVRGNVHGVDVFLDRPNVLIPHMSGSGEVRATPDPFLSDINRLFDVLDGASQRARHYFADELCAYSNRSGRNDCVCHFGGRDARARSSILVGISKTVTGAVG